MSYVVLVVYVLAGNAAVFLELRIVSLVRELDLDEKPPSEVSALSASCVRMPRRARGAGAGTFSFVWENGILMDRLPGA